MTSIPSAGDPGFSALETLVAMLVLAIGVTAISTAFTEGRRVATEADRRQRAIWFAEDKLAEKLALGYEKAAQLVGADEHIEGRNLVGQDVRDGLRRTWWVEPGWSAAGVMRVVVIAEWTRRGVPQGYQVAGLLARGWPE
jgi:prepilin-type N-terminal cleavage/methylation domain-containing protein